MYALARIDVSDRVADHATPTALHWRPGRALTAHVLGSQTITVVAAPHGDITVFPKRHITIPAALRHRCAVDSGNLVFLVALPHDQVLRVHTLAYLDTLYTGQQP